MCVFHAVVEGLISIVGAENYTHQTFFFLQCL